MSSADADAVVIGSGPNGLVAAVTLARSGLRVLVLEAHPRRPGGALGTVESTAPGFLHDVGAGFFPFVAASPAFAPLRLERHGVRLAAAPLASCHVATDGSAASIAREGPRLENGPPLAAGADVAAAAPQTSGGLRGGASVSAADVAVWQRLVAGYRAAEPHLLAALLEPFPALSPLVALGPRRLAWAASIFLARGRSLARRCFQSPSAQRVLPGLALHADVGPDDACGAGLGFLLGMLASTAGFPVSVGGAGVLTDALVTELEHHGGRLELGARVTRVVVRERRAVAVITADGREFPARQAVFADTGAPALFLELLAGEAVGWRIRRKMARFPQGWGTFKVDFALTEAVPWRAEAARWSAVVHTGRDLDELAAFTRDVRRGVLPEQPYLVVGQPSLVDPLRAPADRHTLTAYTHVPSALAGGWDAARETFADRLERHLEAHAPGFRATVLARSIASPADLERDNANLVGGDLGGGSAAWHHQLAFRPVFPHFRYRLPIARLYLCSSYAHPGGGVHGMPGYNAARIALRDLA